MRRTVEIDESARFWDDRVRTLGHTGWTNDILYQYDQPLRRRAVASAVQQLHQDLSGLHILDIGCGTGDFVLEFAQRGAHVVGIDISPAVIAKAQLRCHSFSHVNLSVTGIDELDVPAQSFDLVTSITVLQHVTDPALLARAVQRIHAMLRSRGHLILLELAPDHGGQVESAIYVKGRTRAEWVTLVQESGFVLSHEQTFPQLGVSLLHAFARLRRVLAAGRSEASQAGPEGSASAAVPHRSGMRQFAARCLLGFSYPFDHLLAIPMIGRLALYRIFVFQRVDKERA